MNMSGLIQIAIFAIVLTALVRKPLGRSSWRRCSRAKHLARRPCSARWSAHLSFAASTRTRKSSWKALCVAVLLFNLHRLSGRAMLRSSSRRACCR